MLDYRLVLLAFESPCRPRAGSPGFVDARNQTWACSAKDFRSTKEEAESDKAAADSSVV